MIKVDMDLFEQDQSCEVSRLCYKNKKLIMCADIFYCTGFNIWDMSGVYLLFYRYELVYIGKSEVHIGHRIKSHDNEDRFDFDAFIIIEHSNPVDLEKDLIKELQPKYNLIGKYKKYK